MSTVSITMPPASPEQQAYASDIEDNPLRAPSPSVPPLATQQAKDDEKHCCKHGRRPVSASTQRLKQLQEDWAREVSAMSELRQNTVDLEERRKLVYSRLAVGASRVGSRSQQRCSSANIFATAGMKFGISEPWQPYKHCAGRSSRRTAFVRDYCGRLYTGPERLSAYKKNEEEMNTITDMAEVSSLENEAATGLPAKSLRRKKRDKAKKDQRDKKEAKGGAKKGRTHPYRMSPAGMPSARPLSSFASLSCRRRRWYSDYSGRRILVDLTDLPSTSLE